MKETHYIEYDGKEYEVKEPTLDTWGMISNHINWKNDIEMGVSLISWTTGLDEDEISQASASSVITAAEGIIDYYLNQSTKFYETFEYAGKTYKFFDMGNMTFGQFVDIDEYLKLPETERKVKLSLFMSMLYHEVDENGDYLPYEIDRIKKNAELFRRLPMKYLNGAMVFFYNIGTILRQNTPYSFLSRWWMIQTKNNLRRWIKTRLDGIQQSSIWQGRTFSTLTGWFQNITLRS